MGSYVPPRRESIAEHLAIARRRWPKKCVGWNEGAITPAFVEDLIREDIINGPYAVTKSAGRGKGRRFAPRDYRDLLEVIKLKLTGLKHRRTWLFHLWLRGHCYPIEEVRRALVDEVHIAIDLLKSDIAPTGRWTEPFGVKYDRRVRKSEGADEGLSDLMELLAAKMLRPAAVQEITPSAERIAFEVASMSEVDASTLLPAIANLVEAVKGTEQMKTGSADVLMHALSTTSLGQTAVTLIRANPGDIDKLEHDLEGSIDDGSGRSKLLDTVRSASEERFLAVRRFWRATNSGQIESVTRRFREECTTEAIPFLDFIEPMLRNQRLVNRSNPHLTAYLFATYLLHL